MSSFVLFSKKTLTGFFASRHQPCQQIDCGKRESLWPTLIGRETDIFILLAKFKIFRLALFNMFFHSSNGKDFNDCKKYLYFITNNEGQDRKDRCNYNNLTVVPFEAIATKFLPSPIKR